MPVKLDKEQEIDPSDPKRQEKLEAIWDEIEAKVKEIRSRDSKANK